MQFTKIKFKEGDGKVELAWTTREGPDRKDSITHSLTSFDRPHPDFVRGMEAFVDPVLELLELHDEYRQGLKVQSLSINYEDGDGRSGLVVTCLKELDETKSPLVLNTPHLREYVDEENAEGFMSTAMENRLDRMQGLARDYVNGTREQGDLFEGEGDEDLEGTTLTLTMGGKSVTCTPKQLTTAARLAEVRDLHAQGLLPANVEVALRENGFWHLVEDSREGELSLV